MGFSGYPRDVQSFMRELKANNTKEWFEANRQRFEDAVIGPSVELVAALAEPLSQLEPDLIADPKVNGSIRRIYRDTRFSKDKTPYHTHLHMIFWHGEHPNRSPGVHVVLADDHFGYGAGHWGFDAEQLRRYRDDIARDKGKGVQAAVDATEKAGVELQPPALKTVPKGFDRDERWTGWARYKGLVVMSGERAYPEELFSSSAAGYLTGICKDMQPLTRYLTEKVFS